MMYMEDGQIPGATVYLFNAFERPVFTSICRMGMQS